MLEIKESYIRSVFGNIEWEVMSETSTVDSVNRDNKALGVPVSNSATNTIVRLILPDKRVGLSVTSNSSKWEECFVKAYECAKNNKPRKITPNITSNNSFNKDLRTFKKFSEDELFDSLELMSSVLDNKSTLIESNVFKGETLTEYYNSTGSNISFKSDSVACSIIVGENHNIGSESSSMTIKLPDFKGIVEQALQHYAWSKKIVKPGTGDYPCLFAHDALRVVLQPITASLTADSVIEHKSKYAGKIGELILDEKVSIIDNPLHDNNLVLFDSEANKTQKNIIVKRGVLKGFLHDSYTSKVLNTGNTFNSASVLVKPSVVFHNMEIIGDSKLKDMISDTKKGFMFYDLYPEHTVNNITGAFGQNSSNFYYIENGEIIGVVKGGVVTGNSFKIFKSVDSISKEARYDLGNYNLPIIKTKSHVLTNS